MKKKQKKCRGYMLSPQLPCHSNPVEVVPGLFCGSENDFMDGIGNGLCLDTLVPLNHLDGFIWDTGFRGEILYYPIKDYSVLPPDILELLVAEIIDRINAGKKVGVFCLGGHGRTGYIASIVLGKMGTEDPIGLLREKYCKSAVESTEQIKHIADVLHKPELAKKYVVQKMDRYPYDLEHYYSSYSHNGYEEGFWDFMDIPEDTQD